MALLASVYIFCIYDAAPACSNLAAIMWSVIFSCLARYSSGTCWFSFVFAAFLYQAGQYSMLLNLNLLVGNYSGCFTAFYGAARFLSVYFNVLVVLLQAFCRICRTALINARHMHVR